MNSSNDVGASGNGSRSGPADSLGAAPGRPDKPYDYDWIIIGSGFGGSVSALRLSEKGYRVAVIEQGRRFEDHELPAAERRRDGLDSLHDI